MLNKNKLNLFAFSKKDELVLWGSYLSIAKFNCQLVSDVIERELFIQFIKSKLNINPNFELKIQNLFKIQTEKSSFYIGQLLLDEFYFNAIENDSNLKMHYSFHAIGLAKTTLPISNLSIYPKPNENSNFLKALLSVKNIFQNKLFIEKYNVKLSNTTKANEQENVNTIFNNKAQTLIAQHKIFIDVNDSFITINFEEALEKHQMGVLVKVFQSLDCLEKFK